MGYDMFNKIEKVLHRLCWKGYYVMNEVLVIIEVVDFAELCGSNGELGSVSHISEEKKWATKRRGEGRNKQQKVKEDWEACVL